MFVILSAAKNPRGAGRGKTLASFLTGTRLGKKTGKSIVKSRVQGFFAALRMTNFFAFIFHFRMNEE
jgi:hypothetical protein